MNAISYSVDTGLLVAAAIVTVICGSVLSIRRGKPKSALVCALLSLLLAGFIVVAQRYDPSFVAFSVSLLVLCFACSAGWCLYTLGRSAGSEI
jgi:uncharacterized membrane protein YoaK (UPF0700 family)